MWYYKEEEFTEDITKYEAFVYLITRLKNDEEKPKYYIGKKVFWNKYKIKQTGSTRKKIMKKESDWFDYYGSSEWLNETIKLEGRENFKREIIHLCKTRGESTILEAKEQLFNNVLSKKYENGVKIFYNKQILGKYTREYFSEDELLEIQSTENTMNNTGNIWITNGKESKQIRDTDNIPDGWKQGYHYGKNFCWINNGQIDKKIPRIDINSFEYRNWFTGRVKANNKNKIAVNKNNVVIYIHKNELELYIKGGWVKGGIFKSLKERNKLYVCCDEIKKQKLIKNDEVCDFLSKNPSWRVGQFKRGNFTTSKMVPAINIKTHEKIMVSVDEYKNNNLYTSAKTKKVKVKKGNRIFFQGYLTQFFKETGLPESPFRKKIREGDNSIIVITKGKNKFLNNGKWSIREV